MFAEEAKRKTSAKYSLLYRVQPLQPAVDKKQTESEDIMVETGTMCMCMVTLQ